MYRYAYDDELFNPKNGLKAIDGKVRTRNWDNRQLPTDEVKGGYWLTPEYIPHNQSAVHRLQLIDKNGPRTSEPQWVATFRTVDVKNELHVPFGGSVYKDKLEPFTDNHPEVNPGGVSGGSPQFRTKDGAELIKLENRLTGEVLEGEDLLNYYNQRNNPQ